MTWLIYVGLAALLMFVVGGLDDRRRSRAEARAALRNAHMAGHPSVPSTYREAHARLHARVPHQRDGSGR